MGQLWASASCISLTNKIPENSNRISEKKARKFHIQPQGNRKPQLNPDKAGNLHILNKHQNASVGSLNKITPINFKSLASLLLQLISSFISLVSNSCSSWFQRHTKTQNYKSLTSPASKYSHDGKKEHNFAQQLVETVPNSRISRTRNKGLKP